MQKDYRKFGKSNQSGFRWLVGLWVGRWRGSGSLNAFRMVVAMVFWKMSSGCFVCLEFLLAISFETPVGKCRGKRVTFLPHSPLLAT